MTRLVESQNAEIVLLRKQLADAQEYMRRRKNLRRKSYEDDYASAQLKNQKKRLKKKS
ncbi:hypothetical protein SS1G_13496 [Sclerotinia sclerotiorum 1980 UF-70]|uniref:Uncharacterized protein n=1 Tax=Sclerotinia sclerotiorum (strain ATCC 18683 / 1980 / Ss-1) TaxID=665079 RepID=A7F7B6_SCLS1|nr:hypothetical protein SS1G_13496 [Sclerotinia sclerotiorum 1980 UF-70]EDN98637.1 hypothetical protein SS1G_13496 [Sclerotinia sclerotiorum 1980 UF-70]